MEQESPNNLINQSTSSELVTKVVFSLIGFIALGSAISTLQNIAREYVRNMADLNFVSDWLPILTVVFFALGWFTTQFIEMMLLKRRMKIAGILFLILLFEIGIGILLRRLNNYEVLNRFWNVATPIVSSGAFLRYSVFRNETFSTIRKALVGKNPKSA